MNPEGTNIQTNKEVAIKLICRALNYIHRVICVCHRDIKPQNLLSETKVPENPKGSLLSLMRIKEVKILLTIRIDHVGKYKKLEEEDEQKKREERGVCRAFQKGECNPGDGCRFSHDKQAQKYALAEN